MSSRRSPSRSRATSSTRSTRPSPSSSATRRTPSITDGQRPGHDRRRRPDARRWSINDVTVDRGRRRHTAATFTITLSAAERPTPSSVDYATAERHGDRPGRLHGRDRHAVSFAPGETTTDVHRARPRRHARRGRTRRSPSTSQRHERDDPRRPGPGHDQRRRPAALALDRRRDGDRGRRGHGRPPPSRSTLSTVSGQTVTVDYATANGTATAPGDYTAGRTRSSSPPGETTQDRHRPGPRRHARRGERDVLRQPVQPVERHDHRRPGPRHDHRRRPDALDRRSTTSR